MAQKLKHKVLVVAHKICYMPKIIHVNFRCGTGCYIPSQFIRFSFFQHFLPATCGTGLFSRYYTSVLNSAMRGSKRKILFYLMLCIATGEVLLWYLPFIIHDSTLNIKVLMRKCLTL
ncbi:hypothetical protein RHMOL_Rhmol07G0161900 [Rhododendron molle]|uniref:Uncharacterized protein n=1 Tax=Rhododendron molle TaxID=49168 RepID=A0ACC0N1W7_RHOML|nr:hypothetical protein RHMOL_Rhmol07G0161900 [Rhododendron molle]